MGWEREYALPAAERGSGGEGPCGSRLFVFWRRPTPGPWSSELGRRDSPAVMRAYRAFTFAQELLAGSL